MKKRTLREKKEAFKKAYYAELQKQGLMDNKEKTEEVKELTKTELIEKAEELGIKVNPRMTKAQILELIGG